MSLLRTGFVILIIETCGLAGPVSAQSYTPPTVNYGYQQYNDRNPTGFNHPNNMGYGSYVYQPRQTGTRVKALSYRRFKGY